MKALLLLVLAISNAWAAGALPVQEICDKTTQEITALVCNERLEGRIEIPSKGLVLNAEGGRVEFVANIGDTGGKMYGAILVTVCPSSRAIYKFVNVAGLDGQYYESRN